MNIFVSILFGALVGIAGGALVGIVGGYILRRLYEARERRFMSIYARDLNELRKTVAFHNQPKDEQK